jgi:hypothetical protein
VTLGISVLLGNLTSKPLAALLAISALQELCPNNPVLLENLQQELELLLVLPVLLVITAQELEVKQLALLDATVILIDKCPV